MLTVTQATAVNRLVEFLARGNDLPDAEKARDALALLADAANQKLMAGATGATVRANWLDGTADEIRQALEGDSNDAEHDALVSVADWLGIHYTPIDYLDED